MLQFSLETKIQVGPPEWSGLTISAPVKKFKPQANVSPQSAYHLIMSKLDGKPFRKISREDALKEIKGLAGKPDERLMKCDAAGFAAWWTPDTDYEKARWVAYYFAWLVIFDDDFEDALAVINDPKVAKKFYPQALVDSVPGECLKGEKDAHFRIFNDLVAAPIRNGRKDHAALLANEIQEYIQGVSREREVTESPTVPTLQAYWEYRASAISFRFLLVAHEFVSEVNLPLAIPCNADMKNMQNAALEHEWLVNDILSGYKEVPQGDISLFTILASRFHNFQTAVDVAIEALRHCVKQFDASAEALRKTVIEYHDEETLRNLDKFIKACRMSCTGNICWSMDVVRYKLEPFKDGKGNLNIKM